MLNLLLYEMPQAVPVSGRMIRIYTDFRDFIELTKILEEGTNTEITYFILGLAQDELRADEVPEFIDGVQAFLQMGEEQETKAGCAFKALPVFSFDDDMAYILAAFRQYYGINLISVPYLHWYEFNALLEGLPEDSELKKRIGYRAINPAQIKDQEERKRIKKIQKQLRIKKKRQKALTDQEIGAAFW